MIHKRVLGIVSVCEVAFLCVPEMGTNKIGEVACLEIKYFAHDHCSVACESRARTNELTAAQANGTATPASATLPEAAAEHAYLRVLCLFSRAKFIWHGGP